jgi:hypothetical protein
MKSGRDEALVLRREDVDTADKAVAAVRQLLKRCPEWHLFHFVEDAGDRLMVGVALAGGVIRLWPRYKGVRNRARLAYVFREFLFDLSSHGIPDDVEDVVDVLDSLLIRGARNPSGQRDG